MPASSDPRPRIRWIPVLLGLLVALGLLYLQTTRSTGAVTPPLDEALETPAPATAQ